VQTGGAFVAGMGDGGLAGGAGEGTTAGTGVSVPAVPAGSKQQARETSKSVLPNQTPLYVCLILAHMLVLSHIGAYVAVNFWPSLSASRRCYLKCAPNKRA
jgi:hypothetical protein